MDNKPQPNSKGVMPDGTQVPRSLDPSKYYSLFTNLCFTENLPLKMRILNNHMAHMKATPTFWCASNLLTFNFMIFLAVGYFLYFEANRLEAFEIRYDDICSSFRHSD